MSDRLQRKLEKLERSIEERKPGGSGKSRPKTGSTPAREEALKALIKGETIPEWHTLQPVLAGSDQVYFIKALGELLSQGKITKSKYTSLTKRVMGKLGKQ